MNLSEARVLVTGGSTGIGKAIALELGKCGAKVLTNGRSAKRLTAASAQTGALWVEADITTPEGVAATVAAVKEQLGGLDVLINNAGYGEFERLEDVTWEAYQRVFATNVFGPAMLTAELVRILKKQQHGHIINMASTSALKGFALGSMYASSKFAMRGMTQCWQEELRRFNIRVTLVNPSEVTTAFAEVDRHERPEQHNKLRPVEIAHAVRGVLEMDNRGFIPELTVWATNPF